MNIIRVSLFLFCVYFHAISSSYGFSDSIGTQSAHTHADKLAHKTELTYWIPFSGTDARPMAEMVRLFNESHPESFVRMHLIQWPDYYDKLLTSIQAGQPPDIAVLHSSRLEEFYAKNLLTDLKDYALVSGIYWKDYFENTLAKVIRGNTYLAIPIDTHALVMYYNKDLLKKAGLLDTQGKLLMNPGLNGFISFLETLKQQLPEGVSPFIAATDNVYPFWIWYALYSQTEGGGGYIRNNRAIFNNPQAREAMQVLLTLRDKGYWPENIHDLKSYNLFKFGFAATGFFGVWSTGYFELSDELDFGASTIPRLFDKTATWGDSHTLVLPVNGDQQKRLAAVKFAKWISDNGELWSVAGHVPSNKRVVASDAFQHQQKRPDYARIVDQINFYPNHPLLWKCNEILTAKIVELMKHKMTIDDVLNSAEAEVNALLAPDLKAAKP